MSILHLICFPPARALLPEVQPQMFTHWVYTFSREVIVQSSRHPLVSGFYKLLATCLGICKTIGYFKVGGSTRPYSYGLEYMVLFPWQDVSGEVAIRETDSDMMETDVTDKQACFSLLRKYVKEVRKFIISLRGVQWNPS